ncbi:MAG: hypothetical protein KIT11_07395 [Fimbriimonadaceae bacterium]|nr:hypothetical protein [Fimbriimonadaceae bacterium]QYK56176.1 MAG: hypothetical protein KF733_01585 [Fimbriimonadaceae bacterium]
MLYPEDSGNLARVQNDPAHLFFKKFGESMPKGDWNHPGTKQGVYMIGPNAEYLEGRFAASSDPADMQARLRRALARWEKLREEKGYAGKPVPAVKTTMPPEVEGGFVLRVNMRDLPRGDGDDSGARHEDRDRSGDPWIGFTQWAWNEKWIGLETGYPFVPEGSEVEVVDEAVVGRIWREMLVDNVRGQAPEWRPQDVKKAVLTKGRIAEADGTVTIEFRGEAMMNDGSRGYEATVYGQGTWSKDAWEFTSFDLVAVGMRKGASRFNQRENDLGPAPMGVTLSLYR